MILKKLVKLLKHFKRLPQVIQKAPADPLAALALPRLIELSAPAKQIDLNSRKLVATTLAGDKLATFRGRGMDFDESRIYQPGDDVRLIDWRVTARSGSTHTKIYREERERPVYCFVDFSPSMWFGTKKTFKAIIAAQAASLIAWAASEHGDRLGAVVCDANKTWSLKPKGGKKGVLQLLNLLAEQQITTMTESEALFAQGLLRLRNVAHPGSLLFLFTDAHGLDKTAEQHLAQLSRHCEIILVFIYDPLEAQLPPPGIYTVSDGEQTLTYDSYDKNLQQQYQQQFHDRTEELKTICDRYHITLFSLTTNESPITQLQTVFGAKSSLRRAAHAG